MLDAGRAAWWRRDRGGSCARAKPAACGVRRRAGTGTCWISSVVVMTPTLTFESGPVVRSSSMPNFLGQFRRRICTWTLPASEPPAGGGCRRLETALRDAVQFGPAESWDAAATVPRRWPLTSGIARNTVAEAYAQLVAEGWLAARTGSGTWAASRPAVASRPGVSGSSAAGARVGATSTSSTVSVALRAAGSPSPVPPTASSASAVAASPGSPAPADRPPRFDLRAGSPAVAMFPRAQWLSAARAALQAAPDYLLDYGDPRGLPELRAALAGLPGPGPRRDRRPGAGS